MNLNLLIPSLFWPDTRQSAIYDGLSLPILERLLSRSLISAYPPQDYEAWLCTAFNITRQLDNWPIAPLMLKIDAPDQARIESFFWMRADPVHLRIEQNHIMLADSQAFQISEQEADQITRDLNNNLSEHMVTFSPFHPTRWYIKMPRTPALQTFTLDQVTCRNINDFLPRGDESASWHKLFNETQMILHDHPVNRTRESCDKLTINSVWFWGGGYTPLTSFSPFTHVWSNNELPIALSLASNNTTLHSSLPADVSHWLNASADGNHLVVLDMLHGRAKYRQAHDWRKALEALEQDWFNPIHAALKKGKINQLTITALSDSSSWNFRLERSNLLKFWLTDKPLSRYTENVL